MMNNLFSIFDPSAILMISLNWMSILIVMVLLIPSYWTLFNPLSSILMFMKSSLITEFSVLLKNKKINIIVFITIFLMIMFNNTMGLMAFTFTATSHLAITLSLALPLWLGYIIFSLVNNLTQFLAHLVPTGTPSILMPFMVIIELVSNMIRPITLSVRLAANMIAGHLLMTLLGNQVVSSNWLSFSALELTLLMLLSLETAVAFIQAYVFSVLTTLYASEA